MNSLPETEGKAIVYIFCSYVMIKELLRSVALAKVWDSVFITARIYGQCFKGNVRNQKKSEEQELESTLLYMAQLQEDVYLLNRGFEWEDDLRIGLSWTDLYSISLQDIELASNPICI
ncbi:hypothetical protein Tco_0180417 [Tanacetum coccineum]